MEAARLPLNEALPNASAAVVTYKGRWHFVLTLGVASLFVVLLVVALIATSPFFIVVYGAVPLCFAFGAGQYCSRVELYRNGKLVLHYFVRRSVTICIEEVSEIHGGGDAWSVSFNRSTFIMSANRSATSLVHALMRHKPTIALSGYTLPEL